LYTPSQLAAKYIRYYLTASSGKGHGIHSPFVFDFITHVLNNKNWFDGYDKVENCRQRLLADRRVLTIEDFGAGSAAGNKKQKTVQSIAKNAAKSRKFGRLLFRIANYYQPASMIELGTSLGISAACLSLGNPSGTLVTCEGAPAIAAVARENFDQLGIHNASVTVGNFDETLPLVLARSTGIDLAFIDGNHRRAPTLQYFAELLHTMNNPGIIIFDDIHWSRDMEAAWQDIKDHPASMLTIDLFFIGLVFFNPAFKVKQHFVIRF